MVETVPRRELEGVGIGVPSVVEFETGRVVSSVNLPLADVPLREVLGERIGVPVFVDNDATVAALAEAHDEELQLVARDLVMLTVGTGVGGGMVLGGRIYRGATGGAGELGHTLVGLDLSEAPRARADALSPAGLARVGRRRPRAGRAGGGVRRAAIPTRRSARLRAEGDEVLGADAVRAAHDGDAAAAAVVELWAERVGIGRGQRDQHLRSRGGGDRWRRGAGRRPAAGAGPAGRGRLRASPGSAPAPRSGSPATASAPGCSAPRCWPRTSSPGCPRGRRPRSNR